MHSDSSPTYGGRPTKEVQDQMAMDKTAKGTEAKKETQAGARKTGPKRTLVGPRQWPESSDEQRATSSDESWVRTGRTPIEESTDGEKEKSLYNTNLTPEEMKLINEIRKAKESEEK